ncbi:MAG: hypothetical protein ACOCV2_04100 [Persicimonas sp.]
MSSLLNETLKRIGQKAAKVVGSAAAGSADTVRRGATDASRNAMSALDAARRAEAGGKLANAARTAAASGPVKEVARLCGRAGVAGAVVDGAVGGLNAAKYLREGKIDGGQAAKHVCAEAGCGFVTSSAGTAGTIAVYFFTGTMGPAAMAVGMGASIGSRYAYRQVVGDTLPDDDDDPEHEEDAVEKADVIEEIGPRPQGE